MQLKKLGEFGLISKIAHQIPQTHSSIIKGIGDDAAVVKAGKEKCLLLTTDTFVEGIHFTLDQISPYLIGKKSIAACLSDIAAMGAIPRYYLVSLCIPPGFSFEFVKRLYQGLHKQAQKFRVFLIGGDTVATKDTVLITITMLGEAKRDRVIFRSGASQGDLIYVTGYLGDSSLGLAMLQNREYPHGSHSLIMKHFTPSPRVEEAKALSRARVANSMIDISDGLLGDLRHILQQSRVGAKIWLHLLPLSPGYRKLHGIFSGDKYSFALWGGEDYELLFTVPREKQKKVRTLAKRLTIPLTCIGEITGNASELKIYDKNNTEVFYEKKGFNHFLKQK